MKFSAVILSVFAAVAFAAPAAQNMEEISAREIEELVARQFNCWCSKGTKTCCGPTGLCMYSKC